MNEWNLRKQFENLQMMMKTTTSTLNLCTYNQTKSYFIDGLVYEIHQYVNCIDRLKEEVKQGIITLEMASIDMDYWTNDNNWGDAKSLYDALTCPEDSSKCQRLRDAMELLQKSLGELNHCLLDAPVECYQQFFDLCPQKDGTEDARSNFKRFKCRCMYKDDLLRSMLYFQQKIIYIFYEKDILRFDDCPLQDPHSRKFKFDFELLCNEVEETPATIKFCRCMNHYLIMPDKYTIHLNTAKLGKYLFDYYLKLTYDDFYAIAYLEESLNLYNQKMKDDGFLDIEPTDETEKNILGQPAAERLNYFAPQKNLQALLSRSWFSEVRTNEGYDQAWTDAFVEALMASEWRNYIARQWAITGLRSKVKQIKGYLLGLLADACVLRGSYNQIAMKANVTDDPRSFSRYMAEGKRQPYAQWVMDYVIDN